MQKRSHSNDTFACYCPAQVACFWLMRHLNRRSVVIIAMALLMLISMVVIYYEAAESTIGSIQDHKLFDFGDICAGERPGQCMY